MSQEKSFSKFTIKDFEKELSLELKMRRKVWRQVVPGSFTDMSNQRRYDVLEELLAIIEFVPLPVFENARKKAESAAFIIQSSMFTDED